MPLSQFILFIFTSLQRTRHGVCCSWGKDGCSPGEMLLSASCPQGWRGLGAELVRVHTGRSWQVSKDCPFACQRPEILNKLWKELAQVEVKVGPMYGSDALLGARRSEGVRSSLTLQITPQDAHTGLPWEEVDNAKEPSVMQTWQWEEYSWVSSPTSSQGTGKALGWDAAAPAHGLRWGSLLQGEKAEKTEQVGITLSFYLVFGKSQKNPTTEKWRRPALEINEILCLLMRLPWPKPSPQLPPPTRICIYGVGT